MTSRRHFTDIDELWRRLRPFGRYQVRILLLTGLATLPQAWHVVSIVFIGQDLPHHCNVPTLNHTLSETDYVNFTGLECSVRMYHSNNDSGKFTDTACQYGMVYTESKYMSFVSEFDLVCDKGVFARLSQTLVIAGMFLGAAATSLADIFGRKPVHIFFNVGLFVTTLALSFVDNLYGFLILRFFIGTFQQGMLLTISILWLELVPNEMRSRTGILIGFAWTASVTSMIPFAYFLSSFGWRRVQLGMAIYSAISLLEYWFLDESLRWLIAHHKADEAMTIVRKAARTNNVSFSKIQSCCDVKGLMKSLESVVHVHVESEKDEDARLVDSEGNKNGSIVTKNNDRTTESIARAWREVFRSRQLCINSVVIWALWIVNNLTYYGLVLVTPLLSGNVYINFFFGCVAEAGGQLLLMLSWRYLGRRAAVQLFLSLTAAAMIVSGICAIFNNSLSRVLTTALTTAARGTIGASFNAIYVYTPELFPTSLRNAGLGMASSFGRVAGMLAPFSVYLLDLGSWVPGAVFGGICVLAALALIFVPETKDRQLAQTVLEMKQWKFEIKT